MDCSPPGSSVHEDYPGKNTGVGCHALLQGIFPTQGSNPGLPHCVDSLLSEPPRKPKNTAVGSLSLLHGIFPSQELNQGSPGGFFTSCTTREALVYVYVCVNMCMHIYVILIIFAKFLLAEAKSIYIPTSNI